MSVSDTVDLALITTLSGSTNAGICARDVDAFAVSQSAGVQ